MKQAIEINNKETIMRLLILLISFAVSLLITLSCDSATGPEKLPPGRRDYVWEVDTIKMNSPTSLYDIWGSSYEDVWVGGVLGSVLDRLWHFDGESWSRYEELFNFEPLDILGFSKNDVWISGTFNNLFHFDGLSWSEYESYKIDGYDQVSFMSLWGIKHNKIYASGLAGNYTNAERLGIIMEYNGSDWNFLKISKTNDHILGVRIDKKTNHFIVLGTDYSTRVPGNSTLYRLVGEELKPFYSYEYELDIFDINGSIYVPQQRKIYKYNNENLVLWKDFSGKSYWHSIFGRSENDFFTVNYDGVGHYNGSDLITIFPTNLLVFEIWVGSDFVFIILYDFNNGQYLIVRGKLN